ncbi:MAG: Linalool 8-monooxygenase, partial [Frankiales bacterium]|nr:Linalool 8-monooxygenase [Frankiales bacterium]
NSQIDGELIEVRYANGWFITISTAGHDTTSSTISGIALALARNPELFAKVKADRSLIPKLVEEGLRFVSPVRHFMRLATQDAVVAGQEIKQGDRLMLLFASANRDEDVFPDPDTFSVDRELNKHVAFGTGPHSCTGMHVARLEMKVLLEELFDRVDGIELAGEPKYLKTNFVGGLRSLPVRLVKSS